MMEKENRPFVCRERPEFHAENRRNLFFFSELSAISNYTTQHRTPEHNNATFFTFVNLKSRIFMHIKHKLMPQKNTIYAVCFKLEFENKSLGVCSLRFL
jgi:hypothetical protein